MASKLERALLVVALSSMVWTPTAPALTILGGSDFLTTVAGTFLDFSLFGNPFGLGIVELEGDPVGPGDTDTIIERQDDAELTNPGDTDTIDIEIVALSLQSVSPVDIGGDLFDLSFNLDPLFPTVGEMSITLDDATTPAGSFDSFFDVFVEITITQAGTDNVVDVLSGLPSLRLEGSGNWTSVSPLDGVVVTGAPGDISANTHTPLAPGEFDFYIDGLVVEEHPNGGAVHVAQNSVIPEPGTATLLCLGALGMGIRKRWRPKTR